MKNTNQNHHHSHSKSKPSSIRHRDALISARNLGQRLTEEIHFPVLVPEVLKYLDPREGESYLDLTAGYGGHAEKILERTLQPSRAVLVDRDQNAIDYLKQRFAGVHTELIHQDFASAAEQLIVDGRQFDIILADLGVSSPHLDVKSRGFSVRLDGPLDMRMDQTQQLTAADIVNTYDVAQLAEIFRRFGEEPRATRIARLIATHRPITTTGQLASIVAKAWPGGSRQHPATRTFQALRIVVNNELELLEAALPRWSQLLAPGGRLAVISFHSLEDRIVKRFFAENAGDRYDAELRLLTAKPVTASDAELVSNPRARSAKLRAAVKINKKGD